MGGNFSKQDFEERLANAKKDDKHDCFDVSFPLDDDSSGSAGSSGGRENDGFVEHSSLQAVLNRQVVAAVKLRRGMSDRLVTHGGEYTVSLMARGARRKVTVECGDAVPADAEMTQFRGLKFYLGGDARRKFGLAPLYTQRNGWKLRTAQFLVYSSGSRRRCIEESAIVGLVKIKGGAVTDFLLMPDVVSDTDWELFVASVLYSLACVYNGMEGVDYDDRKRPNTFTYSRCRVIQGPMSEV